MANDQRIMEAIIRIGGEMDNSVKSAMLKAGNSFTTLNKKCAAFEKTAVKAAAAVTAAFAATAVAIGVKAVQAAQEFQAAQNKLKMGTGATGKELERLGEIARNVWKDGMGESLQDVTDALVQVEQVTGLAGKELQNATKYGIMLKDTFAFELNESTRTAHALMKNFGISASEAYGLIAYGAQNGANKNGDLLDTLNEYSVHYKALGLTADQFITSLVKGAEAGSWSVDKVGDAVKEFTIRSKDGSKKSLEAFQMLGLNGAKMTKDFAAGGESAQKAFQQTVKALQAMKDPVKQNAAGVALFGTMFEDLEAGMLDTMASMNTANVDATKTIQEVEKTAGGGIGKAFTRIGRTIKDKFVPIFEKINEVIKTFVPIIEDLANRAMPYVETAVASLNGYLAEGAEHLKAWATNINFDDIKAKIEGVVEKLQNAAKWLSENKETLKTIGIVLLSVYATFRTFMTIAAVINGIANAYQTLKTAVLAVKGAALACKGAFVKLKAAQIGQKIVSAASTVATWAQVAATWALNAAIAVLTSPIFWVIAAVVALIAIGWVLYNNWDEICAWCSEKWQAFADRFPGVAAFLQTIWEQVCANFKLAWDLVCNAFTTAWNVLKSVWAGICALFKGDWDGFCQHFSAAGQFIIDGFKNAWNLLVTWFSGLIARFQPIIDTIKNAFTSAWEGIKTAFTTVFEALPGILKAPINAIISIINGAIDAINGIGFTIPDWVPVLGGKAFSVDIPKLPMLASGGFTNGASIAGEAGTEAVISFDPAHRKENQGYLMTAAEMLGMMAIPKSGGGSTTYNLGGLTFSPVLQTGDNVDRGNILQQLRSCMPDLMDLIEDALREREQHRYG